MKAITLVNVLVRHVVVEPDKRIKNKMVVIIGPSVSDRLQTMIKEESRTMPNWKSWQRDRPFYTPLQMLPDGTAQLSVRSTKKNKRVWQRQADSLEGCRADITIYLEAYANDCNQGVRCRLIDYKKRDKPCMQNTSTTTA